MCTSRSLLSAFLVSVRFHSIANAEHLYKSAMERVAFKSFSSQSYLLLLILQPNLAGWPKIIIRSWTLICSLSRWQNHLPNVETRHCVYSTYSVWHVTPTSRVDTTLLFLKVVRRNDHCSTRSWQCLYYNFSRSWTTTMNSVSSLPPLFPNLVRHLITLFRNNLILTVWTWPITLRVIPNTFRALCIFEIFRLADM